VTDRTADVVVVGGGLIGTAIAWRLQTAGLQVTVVTGERAAAASRVAAGMLAPVTEISFTEELLLGLNLASMQLYGGFVDELEQASGRPAGLRRTATLSVASNADDAARLTVLSGYLDRLGLGSSRLTSRECRSHEPLLAPSIRSGLLVEGDWSCQVRGVPSIPVRPVKGQILRLDPGRLPQPALTVRAISKGTEVYLVPRASGREVVVGATVEELGFDAKVTAGGVYELLRDARSVIPMTAEYALTETSVGWRPATPDNAPILGGCDLDGLVLATGHYRNGVLLTPVTAAVVAALVTEGQLPLVARDFTLDRFSRRTEPVQ
jgi:glycine oxidase